MGGILDLGQVVGPQGAQGPQGVPGPQGNTGPQGVQGANGITPNIQVGTVTTLPPGSNAYFTRQADSPDAAPVFDVGLPRGADSVNDGDMKAAMYDPQGKGEDIFSYTDAALAAAKAYVAQYAYSKEQSLSAETAALYGKGSDAVPDDILSAIYSSIYGSANVTYRWSRNKTVYSAVVSDTINEGANIFAGTSDNVYVNIKYSNFISFDANNNLILSNPASYSKKYSDFTGSDAPNLYGKYFTVEGGNILFGRAGVSVGKRSSGGDYYVRVSNFSSVSKKTEEKFEIVTSTDPNAYPIEGDGWTYTQLSPLPALAPCARIETGNYIGSGTYGENNKNSLTFSFEPKLVVVHRDNSADCLILVKNCLSAVVIPSGGSVNGDRVSWSQKTVNWFYEPSTTSAVRYQMNLSGAEYYYVAIA